MARFLYEKPLFQNFRTKNSFMTPFLLSSYFHTQLITLLHEILGGRMHGPSPTSDLPVAHRRVISGTVVIL